jgi:hypothetical protein
MPGALAPGLSGRKLPQAWEQSSCSSAFPLRCAEREDGARSSTLRGWPGSGKNAPAGTTSPMRV